MFLTGSIYFSLNVVASVKGLYPRRAVRCIMFSQGQYFENYEYKILSSDEA